MIIRKCAARTLLHLKSETKIWTPFESQLLLFLSFLLFYLLKNKSIDNSTEDFRLSCLNSIIELPHFNYWVTPFQLLSCPNSISHIPRKPQWGWKGVFRCLFRLFLSPSPPRWRFFAPKMAVLCPKDGGTLPQRWRYFTPKVAVLYPKITVLWLNRIGRSF